MRRGIILAGGRGTRLHPITATVSKQLLPIYDKPLIYYPLYTLMSAGIRDVLIIGSSAQNITLFRDLFSDGSDFGINIEYAVQEKPRGIADAFLVGQEFIKGHPVALALGDNIFYGEALGRQLPLINPCDNVVFGCKVARPNEYGVASFDSSGRLIEIVEKPKDPPSKWAVPGLYFYDDTVVERTKWLQPSPRGELEIVDLSNSYIKDGTMKFVELPGAFWFDAGTYDGLLEAAEFVRAVQLRTGDNVADLRAIAKSHHWIS